MAVEYNQHTWGYGEELTPDKLNNIEGGVKATAEAVNEVNNNLKTHWLGAFENSSFKDDVVPILKTYGAGIFFFYLINANVNNTLMTGFCILMYDISLTSPKILLADFANSQFSMINVTDY